MHNYISMKKFNLLNKNTLITGSCGLLGVKHAQALLEIGSNIILTDIDKELLIKTKTDLESNNYNGEIDCYVMDVSSEDSIIKILKELKTRDIRIDILINNAAINPKQSSLKDNIRTTRLENFSLDRWNLELSVGLTGAFLCSKIFGSAMAEDNKGGVILNIASDLSVIAPDQRIYRQDGLEDKLQAVKPVTYSVIKAGLIGLTRYLSTYWPNSKNIRANALSPGGIQTNQDPEFIKRLTNLIPMGRMAKSDEYISAIQFLCSDASAYMNGQNIVMDGGRSVL
jgi:NAD(P)-dependent dehydrogenase (short-subunit alcohol dehydrogenase family)